MSLENLLAIKRLQKHEASRESVLKLLSAAKRNLVDSRAANISAENRFDAAYKVIMQCATAALWMKGYRTPTSEAGHHQTTIQTLPMTIGLEQDTIIVLDALRKQRNLADYAGDSVSDASFAECIGQAERLLVEVRKAISATKSNAGRT